MTKQPLKIAIMVHRFYPEIGGVEVTAELLARGFTERHGAQVTVITHTQDSGASKAFPFKVLRAPNKKELFTAIKDADVVFHNNPCLQFYWPQLFLKRPWVVVLRMWIKMPGEKYSKLQSLKNNLKIGLVRRADRLIANSSALEWELGVPAKIIYNSYRSDIFRIDVPLESRPKNSLVYLGRLSADKGISFLLAAIAQLREQGREYTLELIGEGDYQADLERQVKELGIHDVVSFRGKLQREAINAELNKHRIGVVPSEMPEPFGTVALELMGAGCLTLVADHGGLPEAAGDAGLRFAPKSVPSLIEKLIQISEDEDVIAELLAKMPTHLARHQEPVMIDNFYQEMVKAAQRV